MYRMLGLLETGVGGGGGGIYMYKLTRFDKFWFLSTLHCHIVSHESLSNVLYSAVLLKGRGHILVFINQAN